jgi:hypothetical protein
MRLLNFFGLPSSLLVFLLSDAAATQALDSSESWRRSPPLHAHYRPEDSPHRRRDLEDIQRRFEAGDKAMGIKKMSVDESEKFWPEYWGFENGSPAGLERKRESGLEIAARRDYEEEEEAFLKANSSAILQVRPPFLVHQASASDALAILEKRDFQCPTGTTACSGYPSSCCNTGDTCVTVQDTGFGVVGCCRSGSSCGGIISTCGANSRCPSDIGGGCCLPGFSCSGIGCKFPIPFLYHPC